MPTTTYIALLRAVNVAGHGKVGMADLRALFTRLGFEGARSLLQSGNLIFGAAGAAPAELESRLEAAAEARLGLRTDFLVRSAGEWDEVVAANPFPAEAKRDPGRLVVLALKDAPPPARFAALQAAVVGREIVRGAGRHAYVTYPDGQGRSRLTLALIERTLGTRGTARNWNTVLKLAALAGAR
ncbi:MAG TPA: DUF1697 domain-containing protein [Thermoanaerobaculaceae bacterium]|nr:DUF1697 domain-containing protein [Thermoanaerobaculaceae bacterium]